MGRQFQIIGGGLIGLATAYALLERGAKSVRVIEAREGVALETSFANAGMVHASLADPWNGPDLMGHVLGALVGRKSPLKIRGHALSSALGWGLKYLRYSAPKHYWQAVEANTKLANYSLNVHREWRNALSPDDNYEGDGLLKIFRDAPTFARGRKKSEFMQALGVQTEFLDARAIVEREPSLASIGDEILGGIYHPNDFKADAHQFCKSLEKAIVERGGEILSDTRVNGFVTNGKRVEGVHSNKGPYLAQTTIIACGARSYQLLNPLRAYGKGVKLNVRPVKGYSLGFQNALSLKGANMPKIPIVDESLHVAITPFHGGIRIAGLAELADFDASIDADRLQGLLYMLQTVYPTLAHDLSLEHADIWCGFRPVSADGMPVIGMTGVEGLAVHTGHAHLGWTFCAGAAALLADSLLGQETAIDLKCFSPLRH